MSIFNNLTDFQFNKSTRIDNNHNLLVANTKRVIGSLFGSSIDTNIYSTTLANGGTVTAANSAATLATNVTANGSAKLFSVQKARAQVGKNNIMRAFMRFGDTGVANNVREFGIYVDANNQFVFRLSGTTFQVSVKKAGTETTVSSGSFNGNGTLTNQSYTVDTNYHIFEIVYSSGTIRFLIDDIAIHTFRATTTTLIAGLVGQLYASNANTTISTNQTLDNAGWSVSHFGDSVNNPQFVNDSTGTTNAGRTIKSGGGTLQSISVGFLGGTNATLILYDSTTAGGTVIQKFDLSAPGAIGTHQFGVEGVNFYNGLTYVTTGTMTNASFTIIFE